MSIYVVGLIVAAWLTTAGSAMARNAHEPFTSYAPNELTETINTGVTVCFSPSKVVDVEWAVLSRPGTAIDQVWLRSIGCRHLEPRTPVILLRDRKYGSDLMTQVKLPELDTPMWGLYGSFR